MAKKNIFLDKRWLDSHLEKIKKKAGARYTPELNVDLPITEIFGGISRIKEFYTSIREHLGKLNREFNLVSAKYENKEIQKIYQILQCEIFSLLKPLSKLKEYNTDTIPWTKINQKAKKAEDLIRKLSDKLREEKAKAEQQKVNDKQKGQQSVSEKFGSDIHYLYETQRELRHFEELSSSTQARLSNCPLLFLTGAAGTGKTHLLCDVTEDRITNKKPLPVILVFGELFVTTEDPVNQIIGQLGLKLNKNQFLRLLNNAGKQSGCRAILAIDALNETRQRNFWKRNTDKIVEEVKKYPNIALVFSARSGFEKEVLTNKQRKTFVHEEHRGFEFREWEAVNKFFKEFDLPLPEIPLLMPEFQNPLFLLLFCKAFQDRARKNKGKKQKQIFRGHEGATYIFEAFVDSVSKRLSEQFGISNNPGKNVWDAVIEKIAEKMVEQNSDRVSEDQVLAIVRNAYSSIDCAQFIKELDRNLLLVKVPRYSIEKGEYEGFEFRFSFQKFSDHLIGRYLFKKYEKEFGKSNKNLVTAKKFFSRRRKLGKFLSKLWDRGIIEALSIQCPEHLNGCELVEVAPYLWDSHLAQEAFVESLIWRKPSAFSTDLKNTLVYINAEIIRTESEHHSLLNAFLAVAPIPNHPFNANFLHKHLLKFSMAKRDSWWSIFLHYQYGERGAVDRLIEWGWSEHDKSYSDESLRLCSVALAWFLTTPNRFVRDKSTKALVALLTNRLNVVLALLKQFKDINDPYVSERLYAVAYGCALRSKADKNGLKSLSEWVYENIFKNGNPPVHVLLRDYARGIIEVALQEKLKLRISHKRIEPPYRSKFPKRLPSNRTIKGYKFDYKDKDFQDYFWAQNSIIHSMQPEHSEIFMYGDFGRYTFQSALSHFSYPNHITMQKLSNWAIKRVFDLGYDINLHGKFDRNLDRYHNLGRSEHKAERIGKKYQWIALHELLARTSDNFEFKEESWSDKISKYEGPWQLGVRDIDPSCILKEFPNPKPKDLPKFDSYEKQIFYNAWNKKISDSVWLKKVNDLPDLKQIIELTDNHRNQWILLEGFIEWQEETPPEHEKYNLPTRTLWYMIKSYLVKRRNRDKVFNWAKQQHFMGRWMPESHEFYNVYLGEYPWASAFLYHYIPYYYHDGWTEGTRDKKIPAKVLVTDDEYLSSGSSIDCSANEAISVKLPAKYIIDEMNLVQRYTDGRFFDKKGKLVVFDPNIFDANIPRFLIMRKDKLCDFLKRKGCAVFWTLLGEKNMIGGEYSGGKWIGRLELSGAYILDRRNKVRGVLKAKFKQ